MKRSLKFKLILSYLAVALLVVVVVSVLIRLTSGKSLMNLVAEEQINQLEESVQTYYTANGTMDDFFAYYIQTNQAQQGPSQPGGPTKSPGSHEIRGVRGLIDLEGKALIPSIGYDVGQIVPVDQLQQKTPVEVNGTTVAYILPDTSLKFSLNPEEQLFLQRTTLAIALAAGAGILAAVAMGYLLAGGLLKPILRLKKASQALSRGQLEQQVPVTSKDELGELTATFNQMSSDLAQAEAKRKRMTADITHDLSTPLQIISGYIEMLEGREITLSADRLEIIKTEIDHLRRLVGDLSTLTQFESGQLDIQLQPVSVAYLLERIIATYEPIAARREVSLVLELPDHSSILLVDEGRMLQVLKNLVENALRYTPRGGKITLGEYPNGHVQLVVKDNGTGIEAGDLPYIFDRFYRADPSRGGPPGKVGLGLAICKALVTAQGGEIRAESGGKDQGTSMIITFPVSKSEGDKQH